MEEDELEEYVLISDMDDFLLIEIDSILSNYKGGVFLNMITNEHAARKTRFDVELLLTSGHSNLHDPLTLYNQKINKRICKIVEFPVKYCELPLDTTLLITVRETPGSFFPLRRRLVGGTSYRLFENMKLRNGKKTCRIWERTIAHHLDTPAELPTSTMTKLISRLDTKSKEMIVDHEDEEEDEQIFGRSRSSSSGRRRRRREKKKDNNRRYTTTSSSFWLDRHYLNSRRQNLLLTKNQKKKKKNTIINTTSSFDTTSFLLIDDDDNNNNDKEKEEKSSSSTSSSSSSSSSSSLSSYTDNFGYDNQKMEVTVFCLTIFPYPKTDPIIFYQPPISLFSSSSDDGRKIPSMNYHSIFSSSSSPSSSSSSSSSSISSYYMSSHHHHQQQQKQKQQQQQRSKNNIESQDILVNYRTIKFKDNIISLNVPQQQQEHHHSQQDLLQQRRSDPIRKKYIMLGTKRTLEHSKHQVPDINDRSKLLQILQKTTSLFSLSKEEKELVWKYRYWLKISRRDSLVKIIESAEKKLLRDEMSVNINSLVCTNFSNRFSEIEISESKIKELKREILPTWNCDELSFCDALELLSYKYEYYPFIREFAVTRILKKENDESIFEVLLQLVQALRYENMKEKNLEQSHLGKLLLLRASRSFKIAVHLYYLLNLEIDNCMTHNYMNEKGHFEYFKKKFLERVQLSDERKRSDLDKMVVFVEYLRKFLVSLKKRGLDRGAMTQEFRNSFSKNSLPLDIQSTFPFPFPIDPRIYIKGVVAEKCFFFKSKLRPLCLCLKIIRGQGVKKQQEKIYDKNTIIELDDDDSEEEEEEEEIRVIYKIGDDLRQDQVITQTIRLMHRILLNNSMDLKLVPYRILSCELNSGFVEFVPGTESFHNIGTPILSFLSKESGIDESSKRFKRTVRNNYLRSLAGYCVISYILGFGDRHMDNILIIRKGDPKNIGKMFHIDFGYILGVPGIGKRFIAPPIKITQQMADAAGCSGYYQQLQQQQQKQQQQQQQQQKQQYIDYSAEIKQEEKRRTFREFLEYAKQAYVILRKYARLFVTLFLMLLDSNMEQIVLPTDRCKEDEIKFTRIKTILHNMNLEMGKKEAEGFIEREILNNIASFGGSIEDWIHIIGQKFRN